MEGVEGIGPRMPQPMTMADGRPHPMFQQMQARGTNIILFCHLNLPQAIDENDPCNLSPKIFFVFLSYVDRCNIFKPLFFFFSPGV